jgi:hypothetical protein
MYKLLNCFINTYLIYLIYMTNFMTITLTIGSNFVITISPHLKVGHLSAKFLVLHSKTNLKEVTSCLFSRLMQLH